MPLHHSKARTYWVWWENIWIYFYSFTVYYLFTPIWLVTFFQMPKSPQTKRYTRKETILCHSFPCPFRWCVWSLWLRVLALKNIENESCWWRFLTSKKAVLRKDVKFSSFLFDREKAWSVYGDKVPKGNALVLVHLHLLCLGCCCSSLCSLIWVAGSVVMKKRTPPTTVAWLMHFWIAHVFNVLQKTWDKSFGRLIRRKKIYAGKIFWIP